MGYVPFTWSGRRSYYGRIPVGKSGLEVGILGFSNRGHRRHYRLFLLCPRDLFGCNSTTQDSPSPKGAGKPSSPIENGFWTFPESRIPVGHRPAAQNALVASLATLSAVVYGYLYLVFTTITDVFENNYGFSTNVVGLTFIGVGVGMMTGVAAFGAISDRILISKVRANNGELKPEYRLSIMIPGGLCTPIGFFIYGWTTQYRVFWLVPIIGTSLIGAGVMAYFIPIQAYLLDAFTVHAASALAANAIWRSIFGALIPLEGLPMYSALGLGWGNSLLGFISILLIPVPTAILVYGERIRKNACFDVD